MSKNNSLNNVQEDYYKSLNRIMILGLTGMAALGTSMLLIESTKTNASTLLRAGKILNFSTKATTIKRLPALIPKKPNIFAVRTLNKLTFRKPISNGLALSEINKNNLKPKFIPIKVKTNNKQYLKPKNSPH